MPTAYRRREGTRVGQARTLPLFATPPAIPRLATRRAGDRASGPLDLALGIYWSATVEARALAAAAADTAYPSERAALRILETEETRRREIAAELLATVWQVRLPHRSGESSPEAPVSVREDGGDGPASSPLIAA